MYFIWCGPVWLVVKTQNKLKQSFAEMVCATDLICPELDSSQTPSYYFSTLSSPDTDLRGHRQWQEDPCRRISAHGLHLTFITPGGGLAAPGLLFGGVVQVNGCKVKPSMAQSERSQVTEERLPEQLWCRSLDSDVSLQAFGLNGSASCHLQLWARGFLYEQSCWMSQKQLVQKRWKKSVITKPWTCIISVTFRILDESFTGTITPKDTHFIYLFIMACHWWWRRECVCLVGEIFMNHWLDLHETFRK